MFRLSRRFGYDPYTVILLGPHIKPWLGFESVHERHENGINKAFIDYAERKIRSLNDLIFVNSMSDTFHENIPDYVLDAWFYVFGKHPEKQFQILTKRPERARDYFRTRKVPDNCWIGTSCGIASAKTRIDILREINAKVRFVSLEPLLEDLGQVNLAGIQWAIIGGESDYDSPRPMKQEWVLNLIQQVKEQGVKVFFKQWGGKGGDGAGGNRCPCCNSTHQEFPDWSEKNE